MLNKKKDYVITLGVILLVFALSFFLTFSGYSFSSESFFQKKSITGFVTVDIDADGVDYASADLTPLDDNKFILAYTKGPASSLYHVYYDIYYTNGTQFGDTEYIGFFSSSQVKVSALNSTHFVVTWTVANLDPINGDVMFSIYDTDFNVISNWTTVFEGAWGRTDVAALNSTHFISSYAYSGYGGHIYFKMYDSEGNLITAQTEIESGVAMDSSSMGLGIAAINSTHFVDCYLDTSDYSDQQVKCEIYDVEGNKFGTTIVIDTYLLNYTRTLDVAALNSTHWAVSWYDRAEGDNTVKICDINGVINSNFDSDTFVPYSYYSASGVAALNSTHLVTSWHNHLPETNISFRVHDTNGNANTGIINASISDLGDPGSGANAPIAPVASEVPVTGLGICNDNFIIAWNETSDGSGLTWRGYYTNGTEWGGICINFPQIIWENPTPPNSSLTSNQNIYLNTTITDENETSAWFDWNKSLIGYWSMDFYNSTGVYDNSSYDNFGAFGGDASFGADNISDGYRGYSLHFDREENGNYVDIDALAPYISDIGAVSVWVMAEDSNANSQYVFTARNSDAQKRLYICNDLGNFQVGWIDTYDFDTGYDFVLDEWVHIVVNWSGADITTWVNGEYQSKHSSSSSLDSAATACIGCLSNLKATTTYQFLGYIDEVIVFDRNISVQEIKALYNNTANRLYNNFTDLDYGIYNYQAYAIDEMGNLNITGEREINVTEYVVDPSVTVVSPTNTTYSTSTIWFNATATSVDYSIDTCLYSVDSASNSSMSNSDSLWYNSETVNFGIHNVTFYCNNTNGDWNTASEFFSVDSGNESCSWWYNPVWDFRKNIVIDYDMVNGSQTNFPLLVNITDESLRLYSQDDGDDILFTSVDGCSKLAHEIEYFDKATGKLVAWVKIPELSNTSDTIINMYYSNNLSGSQENVSEVWDDNFDMVQHLEESPSDEVAGHDDSKGDYDMTPNNLGDGDGGTTDADTIIDGGDYLNAGDDYLSSSLPSVFNDIGSNDFTISFWTNPASIAVSSPWVRLADVRYDDTNYVQFVMGESEGKIGLAVEDADSQTITAVNSEVSADVWSYFTGTWDASENTLVFYLNAEPQSGTYSSTAGAGSVQELELGRRSDGSATTYYNGYFDEFRVSNSVRSSDWINTSYMNQVNTSRFYSVGGEVPYSCNYIGAGNWAIDCSDNCTIEDTIVGDGSNISIVGNGHIYVTSNVSNFTKLHIGGGNGECIVTCLSGGCFRF